MKKKCGILLLLALLLAGVVYVSYQPMPIAEEVEEVLAEEESEVTTLYIWYQDESLTAYLQAAALSFTQAYEDALADEGSAADAETFEASDLEGQESAAQTGGQLRIIPILCEDTLYLESVAEATALGDVPDLYLTTTQTLEECAYLGILSAVSLEEAAYYEKAVEAVTYEDVTVAYPLYYETTVLLYNATYWEMWVEQCLAETETDADEEGATSETEAAEGVTLEAEATALPATLDEILSLANVFEAPETIETIFAWDIEDVFYQYWFAGAYIHAANTVSIDTPSAVACLETYASLNQFFSVDEETSTYENILQDFIEGKIMFAVVDGDAIPLLEAALAEGSLAYAYGIMELPAITDDLSSQTLSVTTCVAINPATQNEALAEAFAAYLTLDVAQDLYLYTEKFAAAKGVSFTDASVAWAAAVFADAYENSALLPTALSLGDFWLNVELLFTKVWNGADAAQTLAEIFS